MTAERGSALALSWAGVALTVVALVLTVDLTAYLVAAARAQAAADAAALAAVAAADPRAGPDSARTPREEAERVAAASGATLRSCRCARGRQEVEVTVAVPVRAVAVTRFAGRSVAASARARLVPVQRAPERTSSSSLGDSARSMRASASSAWPSPSPSPRPA